MLVVISAVEVVLVSGLLIIDFEKEESGREEDCDEEDEEHEPRVWLLP